ncbi:MAG: hypothetical protein HQ556_00030 [Candidatus Marinimicrobia bacterium]|nr:hypothetical protein [Candidatus Neomarinimicrobiota bacterium]
MNKIKNSILAFRFLFISLLLPVAILPQVVVFTDSGPIYGVTLIGISNAEVTMLAEGESVYTRLPTEMIEKVILRDGRIAFPYNAHQLTRAEYSQYYSAYKPTPEELAQKYLLDGLQLGGTLSFLGYPGAGDEWSGTSIVVTIPVLRYLALRSGWYSLGYVSGSECDCDGSEYQVLAGLNFKTPGLKLYAGRGRYKEQFTNSCRTNFLSGGLSLIGAGYHLNHFGFDIWASTRDASDYKSQINASYGRVEVTENEGSTLVIMLSYIF